jgi:hypothetical protein
LLDIVFQNDLEVSQFRLPGRIPGSEASFSTLRIPPESRHFKKKILVWNALRAFRKFCLSRKNPDGLAPGTFYASVNWLM